MKIIFKIVTVIIAGIAILFTTAYFRKIPQEKNPQSLAYEVLDQGWSNSIRNQVYMTSFGSKMLPLDWFLTLEQAKSETLFSSDVNLEKFGFILRQKSDSNSTGLPIGFAELDDADETWIGLTCAACHTKQIHYADYKILIDGGPAMLDFQQFERELYQALSSTLYDDDKFSRFADNNGVSPNERDQFRKQLKQRVDFFDIRLAANKVDVDYGPARLDAFGQIFNAIVVEAFNLPHNRHIPDAPVSIPMLWDASHLDLVQWNGSAPNAIPGPLGQNATTAMAVYGTVDLINPALLGYHASSQIRELGYIQDSFYALQSPQWPEDIFGEIDPSLVKQGKSMYDKHCLECHERIDRNDPNRKLTAVMVDQSEIKTDPVMAENFSLSTSLTGPLEGRKSFIIAGKKFGKQEKTIELVMHATIGTLVNQPFDMATALIQESHSVKKAEIDFDRQAYKARALSGIWASAPYLHNGSIPSLVDLLTEEDQRPKSFHVGSLEFDPIQVGIDTGSTMTSKLFDTSKRGNSNAGHDHGTDLSDKNKRALIEYLKTL